MERFDLVIELQFHGRRPSVLSQKTMHALRSRKLFVARGRTSGTRFCSAVFQDVKSILFSQET